MKDERACILIPAFNEARHIGPLIEATLHEQPGVEIVVVDDGSTDGTGEQARRRGASVIRHPFNLGYGTALHTGYLWARRRGYRRLVQMDADGQHDPKCLRALLDGLERGADVVVGSRYLDQPAPATSVLRKTGSRMLSRVVTWWTGIGITDPTSGFQAMSVRALGAVANDGFPEDYPDADMLITLARAGLRLTEVPVTMHPRQSGPSMHCGVRSTYYAYKMLLTLVLLPVRRPPRPVDTVTRIPIP